MKRFASLCGIVLLLSSTGVAAAEKSTVTFGLVPQQAASKLAKLWGPIFLHLSEKTGLKIQFKTAPNIPEFEKRCAEGEYDIAYMNPYHYTVFSRSPGYKAFAKQKGKKIRGILVTRKDSGITDLAGLAESKLSFPAPAAFAASVLTRAQLKAEGIPFEAAYVSSHDSVYRSVAKGLFAAGGGIERTFNNVDVSVRDQLQILWTSNSFTPHAFAAHPRLAPETVAAIRDAMLEMGQTEVGRDLLMRINFKKGVEAASDADWDDVRALGIDLLENLIKG